LDRIVKKCAGDYNPGEEETQGFLTNWREPTSHVTKSPFVYTSAHKNDVPINGEFAAYNGGGYVAELGKSLKTAQLVLDQLFRTNWMDRLTRAVFVEAAIYNANVNLFSCLKIIIETPAFGGIYITRTAESFRPYPYLDAWDLILLVVQIVWVLVILYLIYLEVNLARSFRLDYAKDLWTYVQILNILMSLASATLYVIRIMFVIGAIEDVKNNIGEYVSFDKMIEIDETYTASLAIIAFIGIIQILKPLSFSYFFALLKNVMRKGSGTLMFCFFFIIVSWATFGVCSYFILVRSAAGFRTFPRTIWTLACLTIGIIKYPETMGDDSFTKRFIFATFMLVVFMVLMNLVVTIFLEMQSAIRAFKELKGFDRELNEHIGKRLLMLWNAFSKKKPYAWSCEVPLKEIGKLLKAEPLGWIWSSAFKENNNNECFGNKHPLKACYLCCYNHCQIIYVYGTANATL
jgi:polycystin 1L2